MGVPDLDFLSSSRPSTVGLCRVLCGFACAWYWFVLANSGKHGGQLVLTKRSDIRTGIHSRLSSYSNF
jgi:hypothetical protein